MKETCRVCGHEVGKLDFLQGPMELQLTISNAGIAPVFSLSIQLGLKRLMLNQ